MKQGLTTYYACWVRWQQADGFLLWKNVAEPGREAVWATEQLVVPLFKTIASLTDFAHRLGVVVVVEEPLLINLDVVAEWLTDGKKWPVRECLAAWNLFDDLGAGVRAPFVGNHKTATRNRIFDLLYADSDFWQRPAEVRWLPEELALLRNLLTQGFELWQKHACWQA